MSTDNIVFENKVVINLIHAMIGSFSSNFKRVSFVVDDVTVHIAFELYDEIEDDIQEIEDVVYEFEALMIGERSVEFDVSVGNELYLKDGARIIYSRKDSA